MSEPQVNANPNSIQAGVVRTSTTYKTFFVYTSVLNVTLGALFFGYVMSAFNPIQAFVKPHAFGKEIPKILITLMTSFVPLGAGIGAITAGKIASKFGRRKPIMIIDLISILGTVLTLLPSEYSLLVGRLIQGYCVGANSSLVPLYINEVAPTEITGRLGTLNQLLIATGVLLAPIVGLGMPDGTGDDKPHDQFFRVELGIAGIFPLVRILLSLLVFREETPKFLLNISEARALSALNNLYTPERAQTELIVLKEQKEIQSRAGKVTLRQIISDKYRRRLLVGITVSMLQQLSGVNAIIFFSNTIFSVGDAAGTNKPTIYTIALGIAQLVGCFAAGTLIERLGRRFMLISGMAFSAVVLGAFGILGIVDHDSPAGKFLIWAYMLAFGISLGPLPWVYISDILPDIGIGIAALANWLVVFVIGLVFPEVSDEAMGWAFIFFAVCSLLGTVFMLFFVRETTGKSEAQIAAMFGYKGDASEESRVTNIDAIRAAKAGRQNSDVESLKSYGTDAESDKAKDAPEQAINNQPVMIAVHS